MDTLLLEIGTEEIPAGYIAPALEALSSQLLKRLDDARIGHGGAQTLGTPRRLAVMVAQVAEKQESVTTEVIGPPQRVAFDASGAPTMAAKKFAEKVGLSMDLLKVRETEKGAYLCADKTETARASIELLPQMLPELILSLPFPKTMKWGNLSISFARPIQSILALLGADVIPFELGPIQSGRMVSGHAFMHPESMAIDSPEGYIQALENAKVVVEPEKRRRSVETLIARVAKEAGGQVLPDAELVDIVTNLVEYPVPVAGTFDPVFLELPREVLITAMREHQKYFAVVDATGNLMPAFIAVNNTRARDMALVARGHQRVLRARLKDAQFFYRADLAEAAETRIEKLKRVLFQAQLGSVYDKMQRVVQLGSFLSEASGVDAQTGSRVRRAAHLCKADLVSQMVGEFPKLQGIMGRTYAQQAKEPAEVSAAIEEHYRPTYSGGLLPETLVGALLAVADKIDSICGCFSVGLLPTGASDPYALRRQGIGIIQILREKNLGFSLKALIARSVSLYGQKATEAPDVTVERVVEFFENRMAHLLAEENFSKDVIAAVISASADRIPDVWQRVKALEALKSAPDFEPLAVAFKRVVNIIKKADTTASASIDSELFEHGSEGELLAAVETIRGHVAQDLAKGHLDAALLRIASLKQPVDAFFDGVLVMAEDPAVRANRLALLGRVAALFASLADFSKITT